VKEKRKALLEARLAKVRQRKTVQAVPDLDVDVTAANGIRLVFFNLICSLLCCPIVGKGAISVAFVCVCLSVAYIANNSSTRRPSMPKFEMKVPHLRCDSHTSFKVKRSKVRVTDGRGAYRTHYHQ